jgi:hypothetical protein
MPTTWQSRRDFAEHRHTSLTERQPGGDKNPRYDDE